MTRIRRTREERPRWRRILPAAALIGMTILAYLPALRNGWIWDDDKYVTQNSTLASLRGLGRIWVDPAATPQYYPAVYTTFWLERRVFGLNPAGYHLVNVLLHGVNAALLWLLLRRLGLPGAFLAGAIFALHPVQVESVAWVTERKNVLSALFYLLALLAWLRHRGQAARPGLKSSWRMYGASLALFALAMLSKTVAASLPVAILLLVWWKEGRIARRELMHLLPFFILAIAGGMTTLLVEKHLVGASGTEWNLSPFERVLLAGRALWFYAAKLVWPVNQSFVYPRWQIDATVWWQWLFAPAALAVLAALWALRRQIGRGPLAAALYFSAALAPALGFFDVYFLRYSYVADHFQYHASAGLIALGAGCVAAAAHRLRLARAVSIAGCGLLAALLVVLTWSQARTFRDSETLWRHAIERNPTAWMAMNNLAVILNDRGRPDEAIPYLDRSLQLKPDHPEAWCNRGNCYLATARYARAIEEYDHAIQLNPSYAEAYTNRGNCYSAQGRYQDAIGSYTQAIRLRPDVAGAWCNRANASLAAARYDDAISDFDQACKLQPEYPQAYSGRGTCFAATGRPEEAIADFSRLIALDPRNAEAYCDRARLYAGSGRYDEAISDLTRAMEQKPDLAQAYMIRAICFSRTRAYDRAWADIRMLRRLGATPPVDLVRGLSQASGRSE